MTNITQTKKEPTTLEEQTTAETIYEPTKYALDDLDENACSPREYSFIDKTKDGTMYVSCRCKPGYTRVDGGCTFDLSIDDVLNVGELETLESVYLFSKPQDYTDFHEKTIIVLMF